MGKGRKRHVQQRLRWRNRAGDLRGTKREEGKGTGKRRRGRPRKPGAGEGHKVRAAFKASEPVHVTLRAVAAVGRLRTRGVYRAMQRALVVLFVSVTSSKKSIGVWRVTKRPESVSGQLVPSMSSTYAFQLIPAASSCVTRCAVVSRWFDDGSLSLVMPRLSPDSSQM